MLRPIKKTPLLFNLSIDRYREFLFVSFFDAFVTGDDTPGRSNSGLGLSVAKDLLERMNLKISAKADSDKVTFEIKK